MEYRFECTIEKKRFEKPCTVRLADGFLAESVDDFVQGTVYQLRRDGGRAAVCQLQNTLSMHTEDMWTKIRYQDGCLTHHAHFDAPIFPREQYAMSDGRAGFTLDRSSLCELECGGQRYPVLLLPSAPGRNDPVIMVCKPGSGGTVPLARIFCIRSEEDQREYEIQIEAGASALLCAAICSLALTLAGTGNSGKKREDTPCPYRFLHISGEPELVRWKTEAGVDKAQGLDNEEYHGVWSAGCSTVYQFCTDGSLLPVARMQDVIYYWGDYAQKKIFYSNGCLTCTEIPDNGLYLHHTFSAAEDGPAFTIHETGVLAGNFEAVHERILEYRGVRYPIWHNSRGRRGLTEIVVHYPPSEHTTVLPPLARLQRISDRVWDIQMTDASDPILVLAVCSLQKG